MLESGEIKYYVRFCLKHPGQWSALFYYYFSRVVIRIRDKAYFLLGVKNRFHHYPDVIREHVQGISVPTQASKSWFVNLPSTGWLPGDGPDISSWTIPLATYSRDFKNINWFREEKDKENTFALHRFGWLLRWLSLHPAQEDLKDANSVILDWIRHVGPDKQHDARETYSASERVVNWLLYLTATKDFQDLDQKNLEILQRALLDHLEHISLHLEYYDKKCNNHILNNARALYIGGRLLDLTDITALAKSLFHKHLPDLIDPEGVLKEGSSHYQLLLTRTMLEVWWIARATDDIEYAASLFPVVLSMCSSSFYMSGSFKKNISDHFPLVGDLSPDYPVSWFFPQVENNQIHESWWGLWNKDQWCSFSDAMKMSVSFNDGSREWKWLGHPKNPFHIFAYLPNQSRNEYPAAHAHMDFASFLLFDKEGPILVDRGRSTYNSDNEGSYAFSARAHNTTVIDCQPIVPDCRGWRLGYKRCLNIDQKIFSNQRSNEHGIGWKTSSIERLGKSLKWNRDIFTGQGKFELSETLSNPNGLELMIETYFHLAPNWKIDLGV